jgi:HK97 family phage major capsid protein
MELKEQLEALSLKLEGKSKEQAEGLIKDFQQENSKNIELAVKEVREELEGKLADLQKHADTLDVKLQEKVSQESKQGDTLKKALADNFEQIKSVKKGNTVEVKAVGDMTTSNLTGEQPRDYNFDIVTLPSQKVNVADLVGSPINISGGTYTYTKETGGEGSISKNTEGAQKSRKDYDFEAIDVSTDFIAGFARYSKKMRNNLSYITSAIPNLLRRDYFKAENSEFVGILRAEATPSTAVSTDNTKAGMLVDDIATLEDADYDTNGIVVRPSDYYDILKTPKDDLMSIVTFEGGILRVNGLQVLKATWLNAGEYFVGDWSRVNKIVTEGLSLEFSEVEGNNFVKNNITARIESQVALAVEQPLALIVGDFASVSAG